MPTKPLNTSQPPDLVEAAYREAKRRELSVSEFVGELIRKSLPKEERAKLAKREPRGRRWPKEQTNYS